MRKQLGFAGVVPGGRASSPRQPETVAAAKKTKKSGPAGKFSVRGFGRPRKTDSADLPNADVVRGADVDDFYRWLRLGGASCDRVALAEFGEEKMRGLMALESIPKGQVVLSVPRSMSVFLSTAGSNPAYASRELLQVVRNASEKQLDPLVNMLPPMSDAQRITDFFTDEELTALEWDPVVNETRSRLQALEQTWKASECDCDFDYFKYMSFNVVSRAFTLQERDGDAARYIVPLVDMINHIPGSTHALSVKDGNCRVIAGRDIAAGEEIGFEYGGGSLSNDRILQDYGFVQTQNSNDLKIFLGGRALDSPGFSQKKEEIKEKVLETQARFSSTVEEDDALLASTLSPNMQNAIAFRRQLKLRLLEILDTLQS